MQLDEKWAFVYRKQKRCDMRDLADHHKGDCWNHVAFDPEHRLVLGVSFGKRSASRVLELVRGVKEQLQGRVSRLVTSDEYAAYATVLRLVFESPPRPVPSGRGVKRPRPTPKPSGLTYRFSKDWDVHRLVGSFSYYTYNFCWCVRSPRRRLGRGRGKNARYLNASVPQISIQQSAIPSPRHPFTLSPCHPLPAPRVSASSH